VEASCYTKGEKMSMQLMALAMNPNLTESQFVQLSEKIMKDKNDMLKKFTAAIDKADSAEEIQAVTALLPLILMF